MNITEEYINNRYLNNIYLNNPNKSSNIKILYNICYRNDVPLFSIIVPVCNQENIIVKHINSILYNTTEKDFELILIIDSCSDRTEDFLTYWINNLENEKYKLLTNILILKSMIPLFETAADNLGFYCSRGKYCLEIQSDMEMTEKGYNMRLLKPFLLDDNIIGISGRCCHDFSCNRGVGKLGMDIIKDVKDIPNIDRNYYYISETCNRGPLLLDKEKMKILRYLDEVNFFLETSEHDLFARAYVERGWICGYVPIDFIALLENGTTRKKRDKLNQEYYDKFVNETNNNNGFLTKNSNNIPYRYIIKKPLY